MEGINKEINNIEVPNASRPKTPVFKEVYEKGPVGRVAEELIEKTRAIILGKYGVPSENVLIEPLVGEGKVGGIRAFIILRNKDSREGWYAEGHNQHAALLSQLIEKFGSGHGLKSIEDMIGDDFGLLHPWETLKGFIDPYQDGFRSFPESREALIDQLKESQTINDLGDDIIEQMENGEKPVPDWFLTGLESS